MVIVKFRRVPNLLSLIVLATLLPSSYAGSSENGFSLAPVDMALLIDESGSLTEKDIRAEQAAALVLAQAIPASGSRIAIYGFGSRSGPTSSAYVRYCDFTVVGSESGLAQLRVCAERVHKRTVSEGNDTDHVAVLDAAVSDLASLGKKDTAAVPLIVLLTDGKFDVPNSENYGNTPVQRLAEAERQLYEEVLPNAKRKGIPVWTVGFGSPDRKALLKMAQAGGGPVLKCSKRASEQSLVFTEIRDISTAFVRILAEVTCGVFIEPVSTAGAGEASVNIPSVATDGVIIVQKEDPTLNVEFVDPKGTLLVDIAGTVNGQKYTREGRGGNVETLRVIDPLPGKWKVQLSGNGASGSRTSAIWQGVVRAIPTVTPSNPVPGQYALIRASLRNRTSVIQRSLRDEATFDAALSGPEFSDVPIELLDDGKAGVDEKPNDGIYSGAFRVPSSCVTQAEVTLTVRVIGSAPDTRTSPISCRLESRAQFGTSNLAFSSRYRIRPGATIGGKYEANSVRERYTVLFSVETDPPGTAVEILTPEFEVVPGNSQHTVEFRIPSEAKPGYYLFVAKTATGLVPGPATQISLQILGEPPRPPWVYAALLLALVAFGVLLLMVGLRRRAERARRNLKGWSVVVSDDSAATRKPEPAETYHVASNCDSIRLLSTRLGVKPTTSAAEDADDALVFVVKVGLGQSARIEARGKTFECSVNQPTLLPNGKYVLIAPPRPVVRRDRIPSSATTSTTPLANAANDDAW